MPPWPPAFGLPAAGFAAACLSCRDGFPPAAASGIQPGSFLPVAFFPVDFFGPSRFVAGLPFPAPVLPRPLPRLLGVLAIARMLHGRSSRPGVQGVDKPCLAPQHTRPAPARVAELVDALASGARSEEHTSELQSLMRI